MDPSRETSGRRRKVKARARMARAREEKKERAREAKAQSMREGLVLLAVTPPTPLLLARLPHPWVCLHLRSLNSAGTSKPF